MLNIGITCDSDWENYILINNKLKKINTENFRMNALYGKSLEVINNCCFNNSLTLLRHYSDNLCKTLYNLLKICEIWLIFTNHTDLNSHCKLLIEKCEEFNIKYIIISETRRDNDYYSFPVEKSMSFKKILNNTIVKTDKTHICEFNIKEYNDNYNKIEFVPLTLSPEIKEKLNKNYASISQVKKERSIKLLYDKNELKIDKQMKKTSKEINQLEFTKNRLNYYKNNK